MILILIRALRVLLHDKLLLLLFFMEIVCMLILHVLSMMLKLLSLIKVLANTYMLRIIINLI